MAALKKGTKLTDNPRNVRLEIRLTKEESELLEECAKINDSTKTDVIIKGIQLVSAVLKNKWQLRPDQRL